MKLHRKFSIGLLALLLAAAQSLYCPSQAADNGKKKEKKRSEPTLFTRLERDEQGNLLALQTSVVRYRLPDKTKVDLVGAVHVGDQSYYDALNELLGNYDIVLYELVAPPGTRIERGPQEARHPVGSMQMGMKGVLDLEFQLEQIDYSPKHFVHADMSPEEVWASMEQRGESFWTIFTRAMQQSIKQQQEGSAPSDAAVLLSFFAKDRAIRLKQLLAKEFEDLESAMAVFEGPDGSTIVSGRNAKVIEALEQQLEKKKRRPRRIAIFYGAGHMPDLERRLMEDFDARRGKVIWLDAWNLAPPVAAVAQPAEQGDE